MARGIIGKMIRGGATTGAQLYSDQAKNDQIAKRETALAKLQQEFRAQDRAADQTFTAEQNAENREFSATQSQLDRDARATEFTAQNDIAMQQLGLDREKLDLTSQQIKQTLDQGQFGIVESQRLQGLYDVIANPEADADSISRAITVLNGLKGQNPEKYSSITLYGDENDAGIQSRATGVINQATGQISMPNSGNGNPGAGATNADEMIQQILSANPGKDRQWANAYLQYLQSQN